MKIGIGADHAGFELKERIKAYLAGKHEVLDLGVYNPFTVGLSGLCGSGCRGIGGRTR